MDAYILSSPSYVIDELFIDFKECEYDVNSKPIGPGVEDTRKSSRFYKEGCLQFGRDVFRDFSAEDKDYEEIEDEEYLISEGKFDCNQLQEALSYSVWYSCEPGVRWSAYGPYLNLLARSVGEVSYSGCRGAPSHLRERHPSEWIDIKYVLNAQLDPRGYSKATTDRNLASEMASASPDEGLIEDLRLLQIRRSYGWVEEGD